MKTMIAIPCMDTMPYEFVESLYRMKTVGQIRPAFLSGSLIYKARTDLALMALHEKADYVLWIDSDMVFAPDLMVSLMEDMGSCDMVAGICHMRRPPYSPVLYSKLRLGMTPDENEHQKIFDMPEDLFTVEGCGFGCVMMKTSVIQAVVDKYHDLFSPLPGYGEDLSFCIRARNCGIDIWADPKVQLGHKASTIVNKETFEGYRQRGGAID
jgi:GT2 family glycosyltransferase